MVLISNFEPDSIYVIISFILNINLFFVFELWPNSRDYTHSIFKVFMYFSDVIILIYPGKIEIFKNNWKAWNTNMS